MRMKMRTFTARKEKQKSNSPFAVKQTHKVAWGIYSQKHSQLPKE